LKYTVFSEPDIDLLVSFRDEKGQWSRPAGIGADINTDEDESNVD
jgi:hypothetical protein